jgi:CHASE2 domain-containing sensor protein
LSLIPRRLFHPSSWRARVSSLWNRTGAKVESGKTPSQPQQGQDGSAQTAEGSHPVRERLTSKLTIAMILGVAVASYFVEDIQDKIPWVRNIQLFAHSWICRTMPRKVGPDHVAIVEIDDQSYWASPFSGEEPTNRATLGDLIRIAEANGALVIGLDIQLKSMDDSYGDDPKRQEPNSYLFTQIATARRPVVLSAGMQLTKNGYKEEPNILADDALPPSASVGHVNLPRDLRQIPLRIANLNSFAQMLTDKYQQVIHAKTRLLESDVIKRMQDRDEFLYGVFWNREQFLTVSASELLHDPAARDRFAGRIVIIGKNHHVSAKNRGRLSDAYQSPMGEISGVFLHANYVEALLSANFQPGVPRWAGVVLDVLLALFAYIGFASRTRLLTRSAFVVLLVTPLVVAYFLFANLGLYLDFVLPLFLIIGHLSIDHYIDLQKELLAFRKKAPVEGPKNEKPKDPVTSTNDALPASEPMQ